MGRAREIMPGGPEELRSELVCTYYRLNKKVQQQDKAEKRTAYLLIYFHTLKVPNEGWEHGCDIYTVNNNKYNRYTKGTL